MELDSKAWRCLGIYVAPASHIHASQEVITRSVGRGYSPPTIRIVIYEPPAVTIGYFQSVEEEVELDKLRKLGIDVMRRPTGGGAVLMTGPEGSKDVPGWEIYIPENWNDIVKDVDKSFEYLSQPIVELLHMLGIKARFRPKNDIEVGSKKIAGVGQYREYGGILHTGTLLIDFDINLMLNVLKIPIEKISDKAIKSFEERITTIKRELGFKLKINEFLKLFKRAIENVFNVNVVEGSLNDVEIEDFEKTLKKYQSREWIYGIRPLQKYTSIYTKKVSGGLIRIHTKIIDEVLEDILITGDFFIYPQSAVYDLEAYLKWNPINEIEDKLKEFLESRDVKIIGLSKQEFIQLICEALNRGLKV